MRGPDSPSAPADAHDVSLLPLGLRGPLRTILSTPASGREERIVRSGREVRTCRRENVVGVSRRRCFRRVAISRRRRIPLREMQSIAQFRARFEQVDCVSFPERLCFYTMSAPGRRARFEQLRSQKTVQRFEGDRFRVRQGFVYQIDLLQPQDYTLRI